MKNLTRTEKEADIIEEINSARENRNDWIRSRRNAKSTEDRIYHNNLVLKYNQLFLQARIELKAYRKNHKS